MIALVAVALIAGLAYERLADAGVARRHRVRELRVPLEGAK